MMITTLFFLLAIIAWQYDFSLRALPPVVQGYAFPFAVRSKRIFYSPRVLTALSNGQTPIYDKVYVKRISKDKQQLEDFINAAVKDIQSLKEQGKEFESKELGKRVRSARRYLTAAKKLPVVVVDTSVEALSNGQTSICTDNYLDQIKDDKEKLQAFVDAAEKDQQILKRQGKDDERDQVLRLQGQAILFLKLIKEKPSHKLTKKKSLEESQQDVSASSAEQTQRTEAPDTAAIHQYLSRNVKAIPLPELFNEVDETYAPLILDGASGVGKTQQAFALLKTEKCQLIYLNLASVSEKSQKIYREMTDLTQPDAIEIAIPIAMKQVKSYVDNEEKEGNDRFSVAALGTQLKKMFVENQELVDLKALVALKALVEELQKSKLVYNKGTIVKIPAEIKLTATTMKEIFNKVVLFIDEALPQGAEAADHSELRFL